MLWIQFALCAGLILIFGSRLSAYADVITKKGYFSAGLMGVLFLAAITSLPELFTSIGSVTAVSAPDLAAGDLIGAVIINVFVIAVFGLFYRKGPVLAGQTKSNVLTAVLTILMLGFIIGFISMRVIFDFSPGALGVGMDSAVLGLIYIIGISIIYKHETRKAAGAGRAPKEKIDAALWANFLVSSAVIIASGFWLAKTGKSIADAYGWNEMYIGLVLVAIATTLPEFVVSLTALKLGAADMAAGNLLGSNFFNLFIITLADIFFRKGQIFRSISGLNAYSAFFAIILTSIALACMLKKGRTGARTPACSIIIIILFAAGHLVLFNLIYSR